MPRRSLPKPRIFISHSAHEPEAQAVLKELVKCLKPHFDVLIDKERLIAGEDFRDEIFTWINRAHGAIVLFSPSALASHWVRTEASVLAWRRALDKGKSFFLIPVLLPPVKHTDLDAKEFSPLSLSALHLVRGANAKKICAEVLAGLQPLLSTPPPDTPLERLARQITNLLRSIEPAELMHAARAMDIDLSEWTDEKDYPKLLAREMLERGLESSIRGIRELDDFLGPDDTERLIELVAPVWVRIPAASRIPHIATRPNKMLRKLWVNGGDKDPRFTASHFVRRACCRPPTTCWPVLLVPPDSGEDEVGHYKHVIKELLRSEVLRLESADDEQVKAVLDRRERDQEPIFVAFYPPGPEPEVIAALRAEFSTVTFFILTGIQSDESTFSVADVQFLEPKLQAGEEFAAYAEYINAISYRQSHPRLR